MKRIVKSVVLLLAALMVTTSAAYDQIKDGVYQDGSTLYITSGVTSIEGLNLNPSIIYCFASTPPACEDNTFTGYEAALHMPPASFANYFIADYWGNFAIMYNDAVEPTGVTLSDSEADLIIGNVIDLSATVAPSNASLRSVEW